MSGSGGQVTSGAADQRSLPLGGMQKPEAILKSLPVPDLRFEAQRLMIERELKLHLGDLSNFDAAGNGGAHAAFAQVFRAAKQYLFTANDNADIEKKSREGSWCAPWLLFFCTGHNVESHYHKRKSSGEILKSYFSSSFLSAHCACPATTGSGSAASFRKSPANSLFPLLPMAMATFRRSPAYFARFTGEPRKVRR